MPHLALDRPFFHEPAPSTLRPGQYRIKSAATTLPRLFTDKADGAAASDSSVGQSLTQELAVPWRQTILQRLHIHSGAKPKPRLPPLDTRPSTAPSLPTLSIGSTTSDSDAIIAELAQIMPRSPSIQGPPHTSNKRSRSCESRNEASTPAASGNGSFIPSTVDGKPIFSGVRLPAYLSKSKAEIQTSFEDLESKQRSRLHDALSSTNSPFKLDRSIAVLQRNRYGNIQPWEKSRVKLNSPIQGSNYINASPIRLESRALGRSSFSQDEAATVPRHVSRYIATQGPKDDQISHFWHMVMQQTPSEGGVIIMLTRLHEGLKEKCALYFPRDKEDSITLPREPKEKQTERAEPGSDDASSEYVTSEDDSQRSDANQEPEPGPEPVSTQPEADAEAGEYTEEGRVELISLTRDPSIGCQVRQLKLTFGGQSKIIHHYLYANWVDFGKPEAEDRLALLQLMRVSRQVAGDSARIVHCSAGVGRTGTWIALDFLLRELEEGRLVETFAVKDLIHDTVDLLRTQRMMMVMNVLQYSFLYEVLHDLFIDKYADKQSGVVVLPRSDSSSSSTTAHQDANDSGLVNKTTTTTTAFASSDTQERSPKIARTQSGNNSIASSSGTPTATTQHDEDTVSEADTIIEDTATTTTPAREQ
ncbi:hypothetical protein DV738_g5427, partial [Chaetothyriales sp. CBS 135597]